MAPAATRPTRPVPETLARDPFAPSNLVVDDEYAYWVSRDETPQGTSRSRVMRAGKDGSELTILADGVNIESLAADDTHLYWTDRGAPRHEETECDRFERWQATCKTQEPGVQFCDEDIRPTPESEARAHRRAHTAALGSVMRVSKHGGSEAALAAHRDEPGAIGVVDGRLYWLENHALDRGELGMQCGAIMTLAATGGGRPQPETNRSYFEHRDRLLRALQALRARAGGPAPATALDDLAMFAALSYRQTIAYAQRHCAVPEVWPRHRCGYMSAVAAGEGHYVVAWNGVLSVNNAVDRNDTRFAIPTAAPAGVAIDDHHVYWLVDNPQHLGGELWRVALTGGAPERLVEYLGDARDIVVDRDHIYWIQSTARTIMRLGKP